MEKTIANKMSLYDIVTLIVPSALVCYVYDFLKMECSANWIAYVTQFGVILMFGLLLKSLGAWWASCWFRNNTDIIREEEDRQFEGNDKFSWCGVLHTWVCDPIRFIAGPFFKLCQLYTIDKAKLKEYYDKYDIAYANKYYGKRIELLESHVAFLQTWIWALVACLWSDICETWMIVVAIYFCVVVMSAIQRKIYNMIWECPEK